MRKWVKDFRPVRQRTVRGETTKDKSGMLPPAVYANTGANFMIKHLQLSDDQDNQPEHLEDIVIDDIEHDSEIIEGLEDLAESDQESEYESESGGDDDVDDELDEQEQLKEQEDQPNDKLPDRDIRYSKFNRGYHDYVVN